MSSTLLLLQAENTYPQNHFKPSDEILKSLIFSKELNGEESVVVLPGPTAAEFMFAQFWFEYDWKITGEFRFRHENADGKITWKLYEPRMGLGLTDRLDKSRNLGSWVQLVKFGKKNPAATVPYLVSVWRKPDPAFQRFETDLIPFIILDILQKERMITKLRRDTKDLENFAKSKQIIDIWKGIQEK